MSANGREPCWLISLSGRNHARILLICLVLNPGKALHNASAFAVKAHLNFVETELRNPLRSLKENRVGS